MHDMQASRVFLQRTHARRSWIRLELWVLLRGLHTRHARVPGSHICVHIHILSAPNLIPFTAVQEGCLCTHCTPWLLLAQVSHTCKLSVTDLYNSTHIANMTDYYKNHEYNTYMYAHEAGKLIHAHVAAHAHDVTATPFFLYMAFQNCHAPYQVPFKYQDMYPNLPANKSQRCFNGMVTAMDDSVGYIHDALTASGMYANTIMVYSSDNGGPDHESNNMPLRGAKFGLFEGSFRVPAFVHSPLLPASAVGKTSGAMMHITDWYRIFARLAGVAGSIVDASGPVPPDGVDTWDAITSVGSSTSVPSPRTMIVHDWGETSNAPNALRSGDYKLIYGKVGISEWIADISYDTGCSKLLPPINASVLESQEKEMPDMYGWVTPNPLPVAKPSPPPGPGSGLTCTQQAPCLFNVIEDPTEHHEISAANPSIVARLISELAAYVAGRYTGGLDQAKTSEDRYCQLIKQYKWVQPYDDGQFPPGPSPSPPPPSPGPPSPPGPSNNTRALQYTGRWAQNYKVRGKQAEIMDVTAWPNGTVHVKALNCTGCCWASADGSVDSRGITVATDTTGCTRTSQGILHSSAPGPMGLEINWIGGAHWESWVKISSAPDQNLPHG